MAQLRIQSNSPNPPTRRLIGTVALSDGRVEHVEAETHLELQRSADALGEGALLTEIVVTYPAVPEVA